jgi:hypothetical protein
MYPRALFTFRPFLVVITVLLAYWAHSGTRALALRRGGPRRRDAVVSIVALTAAALFAAFVQRTRFRWAPMVIYSTLGTLVTVATYDLARFAFPRRWFATLWLREHIVKMIGAWTALLSAFASTVLPTLQPLSQLLPSVIGTAAMIWFLWGSRQRTGRPIGHRRPVTFRIREILTDL